MRKIVYIAGLLMFVNIVGLRAQIVFFEGNLKEAQKKAKSENKKVFVDFYTVWCEPCKMMEKEVFSREDVGEYFNGAFICCRMDAEQADNKAEVKKYGIDAYPTMIVMDADGNELKKIRGAVSPDKLLQDVRVANGDELSFEKLYEKYKKNKKDFDVQQEMLIKAPYFIQTQKGYEFDKWSVRINALFEEYVKNKGLKNMVNSPDFAILSTFHIETGKDDPIFEHIVKNYEDYCKEANAKDVSDYIIMLNNSYIIQMCKKGNQDYKLCLERVNGDLKVPYSGSTFGTLSVYEAICYLADGTYYLYKKKDNERYFEIMDKYLSGLGNDVTVNDYTQALEDLYTANQGVLPESGFRKSVEWIGKALEGEMGESIRVRLLIMLGDCYVGTGLKEKARQSLNQAFLVSARIENKEEQKMFQNMIKTKLEQI